MKLRFFALALFAAPLIAGPPRVINGNVQTIASIAQVESQAGPLWAGYSIPTAHPLYVSCWDGWSHCDQCRLDGDHGFSVTHRDQDDIGPAGSDRILLFARIRDQQVERLRYLSPDCTLDAAGQTVQWIENVAPADSLAFLTRIVDRGASRARKDALLALSLHAGGIDPLINIARHNPSGALRTSCGTSRGTPVASSASARTKPSKIPRRCAAIARWSPPSPAPSSFLPERSGGRSTTPVTAAISRASWCEGKAIRLRTTQRLTRRTTARERPTTFTRRSTRGTPSTIAACGSTRPCITASASTTRSGTAGR